MDVTRAIRRIALRTAHCEEDSTDLGEEIAALLSALPALDRRAVVRHVYWRMPDVPTVALEQATGGAAVLRALAGRGPVTGGCRCCGRVLRACDRDVLDEEVPPLCDACATAGRDEGRDGGAVCAPLRGVTSAWEFQSAPRPWRPRGQALTGQVRHWAEQYPDAPRG